MNDMGLLNVLKHITKYQLLNINKKQKIVNILSQK